MLGEDGDKMSKSKRNYREPHEIFDRYGADALRWYFFANQAPWTSIRYKEQAIRESIPEFLLRLWNVYSFFVIYANLDGFDPAERLSEAPGELAAKDLARGRGYRPPLERGERGWILGELHATIAEVVERMDAYDSFLACRRLNAFVDGLSNWYVRRSRGRFWSEDKSDAEKVDAYWTLFECLVTLAKLVAPFVPFLAETLWRNLTSPWGERVPESVHLCDYPDADRSSVDAAHSERMGLLRGLASLGRNARMEAKLKVRQPLSRVEVVLSDRRHQAWLESHDAILREELNVKRIEYASDTRSIEYLVQPNFKRLGPRVGSKMPALKAAIASADGARLLAELRAAQAVRIDLPDGPVTLDSAPTSRSRSAAEPDGRPPPIPNWAASSC